jgi:hypothetical protein
MIVAIHQPNFFPWLGYFDKIARSDVFVFMDNVDLPRCSSGSWVNRVKLFVQGQPVWMTCPIKREHGGQLIKDVKTADTEWRNKLFKTLTHNYRGCACFSGVIDWVEALVMRDTEYLAEYNMLNIREICARLNIGANFVLQSQMETSKASTELLIEITKKVAGDSYMCGGGAQGYQEADKFSQAGIKLIYQNFIHPKYSQHGEQFTAGLSILDAIFNLGFEETRKIIGTDKKYVNVKENLL